MLISPITIITVNKTRYLAFLKPRFARYTGGAELYRKRDSVRCLGLGLSTLHSTDSCAKIHYDSTSKSVLEIV